MLRIRLLRLALLTAPAMLGPQAHAAGLCVFDGGSYSEGARVCAEPGLLMTCSVSGDRAVWTVDNDKSLTALCASRRDTDRMARRQAGRGAAAEPATPPANAPKCFTFAGRRYCE